MSALEQQEFFTIRDQMDAFKVYIPYFDKNGPTADVLSAVIEEHAPIKAQLKLLRDRYEASKDGTPILNRVITRTNSVESLVNNKLNNAYGSDIVDTKNGYFLGNPITYTITKEKVRRPDELIDAIDKMRIRDNLPDKDATLGKRTSIGGYGARLCYIAIENDKPVPRITNLRPEEVIFFYNETMAEPAYSLHYYDTKRINDQGEKVAVTIADFYDATNMYRFAKSDGDFKLEDVKPNGFLFNPLFGVENNDELTGEEQKVVNLVNAFDRTLSDASNEIEASRLAILILSNLNMDPDDIEKMKQAGVLELFGEEGAASYLTKDVNDTMIENHLNRLNKQIMRFAKSVDFSDEQFASNLSGIAILFKTMALEHKSIIAENKFRAALQYQMKVMCSAWSLLGICEPDDYLNIWFAFKRNLPHNKKEEAEIVSLYQGILSERTLLSMISDVDDIDAEIKEKRKDEERMNSLLPPLTPITKHKDDDKQNESDLDNNPEEDVE